MGTANKQQIFLIFRWLPALFIVGCSWYLSSQETIAHMPRFWNADKLVHCICFAGLAFWVAFGIGTKVRVHKQIILSTIIVSLYGIIDELHQSYTPGRESSVFDWLSDTLGAGIGSVVFAAACTWMCARTTATIKKLLHSDIHRVWHIVTSLDEYTWRSTIHTIERVNNSTADTVGKQFVEYDATGYATTFTITAVVPYARWELDMENDNIKGHWIGIFTQCGEQTEISFTEHVVAKKILLKPFIKSYLKKQQAQYVADLEKELAARRRL